MMDTNTLKNGLTRLLTCMIYILKVITWAAPLFRLLNAILKKSLKKRSHRS